MSWSLLDVVRAAYLSLLRFDPFVAIQHALASRWFDAPMCGLTVACESWSVLALGCAIVLAVESTRPRRALVKRWAAVALPLVTTLCVAGITAYALKHALHTPRPLGSLEPRHVRVLMEPLRAMGLPSGHSVGASALAAFLTRVYPGRLRWTWALAFLGGLSRVYVGAHFLFDVVAGWLLGACVGWIAAAALRRFSPRPAPRADEPART